MAKQIWLYSLGSYPDMSLSCWMWNRTPCEPAALPPPYGASVPVTIPPLAYGAVPLGARSAAQGLGRGVVGRGLI